MKKLIALFAILALVFAIPFSVSAADNGYVFTNWDVSAQLGADNVLRQTEVLNVHFYEQSHGIYRSFPQTVYVEKQTDKGLVTLPYKIKITDVKIPGYEYEISHDNGLIVIRIGDEDTMLSGDVEYTISFTMDIGDDRTEDYDEIFYSLLGADITTNVEHCSFSLQLDKPLPAGTELTMFSGQYGSVEDSGKIKYEKNEYGVVGETIMPLDTGESITAYAKLPEGYFEGERGYSNTLAFVFAGVLVALSLACILFSVTRKRKKPIQTVEFYPPDGVNSAEVGYIVDGSADDKDLLSLIVYFADKGYCTLSGKEDEMSVTKIKELGSDAPEYMRAFFNALFSNGDVRELASSDVKMYEALQGAKGMLSAEFTGKRRLYSGLGSTLSFIIPIILCILFGGYVFTSSFGFSEIGIVLGVISALFACLAAITTAVFSTKWTFASKVTKAGAGIGITILGAIGLVASIGADYFFSEILIMPFFSIIIVYIAVLLGSLAMAWVNTPTAYFTQISGKLLGLKSFIEKAELERIKLLVKDDPSYFYSILPYAYVFNLSDKWIGQFETLSIEPPSWYVGSNMNMFSMYWITRSLTRSHTNMMQELSAQEMKSGGHGGTSFGGGGGGFSGGGFGGGGAGRW